jgi:hypothetical protein
MSNLSFPAITPDFMREIELPPYGIHMVTFPDGGEVRQVLSEQSTKSKVKLEFINRNASEVGNVLNFYKNTRGVFGSFTLPLSIWRHPLVLTNAYSNLLKNIVWRFDRPISIKTIRQDVYSFDTYLISVSPVTPPNPNSFPDQIL